MPRMLRASAALLAAHFVALASIAAVADAQTAPTDPVRCPSCVEWNKPHAPFKVFGNTYYVGTDGLTALLVTSPRGHVLLDGALAESAPQIIANVRKLGFLIEDVRLIVNSHAHYDHAAGIAELQRASGARVAVHPWSAQVMRSGKSIAGDPQLGLDIPFPRVDKIDVVKDGETVRAGDLQLVAHFTGGHTPGSTTWSWRSCEGAVCHDMVYADSQTPVSADDFLFTRNTTYPNVLEDFARGFTTLESLACGILMTPHPTASRLFERHASGTLVDASGCRSYAKSARERLAQRVARERK